MLWAIAVLLIVMWMLGLRSVHETGLFIHALYAAAVVLLVVSISREVTNNRALKQILRRRDQNKRENDGTRSKQTGRYRQGFSGISGK